MHAYVKNYIYACMKFIITKVHYYLSVFILLLLVISSFVRSLLYITHTKVIIIDYHFVDRSRRIIILLFSIFFCPTMGAYVRGHKVVRTVQLYLL